MSEPLAAHKRLRIHGVVQGVYYRASTIQQAQVLGLSGWVRNRRDGSVEAFASGSADAVEKLIAWAHTGPASARVERVDVTEMPPPSEPMNGFRQLATE